MTIEKALTILNTHSDKEFFIDLDSVWEWVGYARKDNALKALKRQNIDGLDFSAERRSVGQLGQSYETKYFLSLDCFKDFCMKSPTAKGREVRGYFIEAEKRMRKLEKQLAGLTEQFMEVSALCAGKTPVELVECYSKTLGIKNPNSTRAVLVKMGWNGKYAMYQHLILKGYGDKLIQVLRGY